MEQAGSGANFNAVANERTVVLSGCDDDGRMFCLTLDRVWTMNLAIELGDWLSGFDQERVQTVPAVRSQPCGTVLQASWTRLLDVPPITHIYRDPRTEAARHVWDHAR